MEAVSDSDFEGQGLPALPIGRLEFKSGGNPTSCRKGNIGMAEKSSTEPVKRRGENWQVSRLLYLLLVGAGTLVAFLMPLLPSQLPLCLFRLMTGYPCAGCGMMRSVEAAVRGHFREAVEWHPLGLVLFVAAWVGAGLVGYELLTQRPLPWEAWLRRWGVVVAWALFVTFLVLWLLRLSYYRYGQWLPIPLKVPL